MGSNGIRGDNKLAHGPLSPLMRAKLKVRTTCDACIGFGTPYCIKFCREAIPGNCPVTLDAERLNPDAHEDSGYVEFPCNTCDLRCPCRCNTPERRALIAKWWTVRCNDVAFERRYWRVEPDVLGTDVL